MRISVLVAVVVVSAHLAIAAQGPVPGQPVQTSPPVQTPPRDPGTRPQQTDRGTAMLKGIVVEAESGRPIRGALVTANAPEGGRAAARTDDEGRFTIGDLPAGRYIVMTRRAGYPPIGYGQRSMLSPPTPIELGNGEVVDRITIAVPRGGVIAGRVFDEYGEPAAGVEVRALQYRFVGATRQLMPSGGRGSSAQTDDLGAFRLYGLEPGQYYVQARPSETVGLPTAPNLREGATVTYYPSAVSEAGAQRVPVVAGGETTDVVIALATTALATVRGRALRSNGEPFSGAFVQVVALEGMAMFRGGGPVRADGTFEIGEVAPGTYRLAVQPRGGGPLEDEDEIGRATITVSGADLDGVLITGGKPAIATGVLMTDDGSPLPFGPHDVNLQAIPAGPRTPGFMPFAPGRGRVRSDYTFELRGLDGDVLLRVFLGTPAGRDWSLRSVFLDGQDVTDTPLRFDLNQQVDGIEIVLTRKQTEVSGTVSDTRGAPVPGVWLIAFPGDRALWTWQSRHVRAVTSDADGKYRFRGLPPHRDYRLVAVADVEPGQWSDPEFLDSISAHGTRFPLGEGEARVQNVRVERQP